MSDCYIPEFVILNDEEFDGNEEATLPEPTGPMEHPKWVGAENERKIIEALTALPYPFHRIWLRPPNEFEDDSDPTFGLIVSGVFSSREEEAEAWADISRTARKVAGRLGPATQIFDERDLVPCAKDARFLSVEPNWIVPR